MTDHRDTRIGYLPTDTSGTLVIVQAGRRRLKTLLLSYKQFPATPRRLLRLSDVYDRAEAVEVMRAV